jgi:phosphoribosylamine--glycine ligase
VVLPRLESDLVEAALAVAERRLSGTRMSFSREPCIGVVLASGGYPRHHQTGYPISGLEDVDKDVMVFHAGTKPGPSGQVLTAGGRVLTVVARGKTMAAAREKVYTNISRISFQGMHYRKDIALV